MIEKDSIVTLKYTMRNGRGEVLEDRTTTYIHGSAEISLFLQEQLEGLEAGQQKKVFLNKGQESADDDFTFDIVIEGVRRAMQIHLLSGFLGSGKTTAIQQACRILSNNRVPTAVITNDQGGNLVDGALFQHLGIPGREVTEGCFCCNYDELDRCIASLTQLHRPVILFAESVGSCTDLVATVLKPLLNQYPGWTPTVSVFADAALLADVLADRAEFHADVTYIYLKQLEEAQVIVVSKIDKAANATFVRERMAERFPGRTILYQNSFDSDHILHWLQTLERLAPHSAALSSLQIDYDRYAAGEAQLAWLDQQLLIESPSLNAQSAALSLLDGLSKCGHPIGHVKGLIDKKTKVSFTSTGSTAAVPLQNAATTSLLINARIETTPNILSQLMTEAIESIEKEQSCTIHTLSVSCFQPGFPRPTHRISS